MSSPAPCGALLVDKPVGPTSHDVVRTVRRAVGSRAVGHTGTLDPFASGLLVVMVGRATRLCRFVEGLPKVYHAVARLGQATDTDDRTGQPVGTLVEALPDEDAVRRAVEAMAGTRAQRPPAFSAKQVGGVRSHRAARAGVALPLAPVTVTVHDVAWLGLAGRDVTFRVTVSAGTYVRALARDLGEALGCGAHLLALRREAIGPLRVEAALAAGALVPGVALRPPLEVLGHLPPVRLAPDERRDVGFGRPVARAGLAGRVALVDGDGALVAVAEGDGERVRPVVVLEGS
ncbi:MAG: tRNA pseudouridine(55) synthase TruB [Gemmatimonadales bacterium]|nr:tRNA pseudouridine(55) synthase TruB [Gemmatimonadales bacterium]